MFDSIPDPIPAPTPTTNMAASAAWFPQGNVLGAYDGRPAGRLWPRWVA